MFDFTITTDISNSFNHQYSINVFYERLFNRHLEDEEVVSTIIHKHWLIGVKYLFLPILSLVVLSAILTLTQTVLVLYIIGTLLLVSLVWLLRNFFDYYLDAWIITDTGIIDVEWHGWFHRESSRVLFSDIQGVSYEIKGVFGTLCRAGTISIEKVSTGSEISMQYVKRPRSVEATILKNMEDYLHSKNLKDSSAIQDLLVNVIAKEMQLQELQSNQKKK